VCWPCHESCETCAGAGQDSCLNCSPSYNYVTDLAVCLQTCPDGYFESEYKWKENPIDDFRCWIKE
jgi:proprotein convertase subtilisin/kexin type 5